MREPCFDVFSKSLEGGAYKRGRSRHFARSNGEASAGFEQYRLMIFQSGGADLGSLQIAENAERLAFFAADFPDQFQYREFALMRAVREIQPDDVNASPNQVANHRFGVRGGPQSGHDLGAAL